MDPVLVHQGQLAGDLEVPDLPDHVAHEDLSARHTHRGDLNLVLGKGPALHLRLVLQAVHAYRILIHEQQRVVVVEDRGHGGAILALQLVQLLPLRGEEHAQPLQLPGLHRQEFGVGAEGHGRDAVHGRAETLHQGVVGDLEDLHLVLGAHRIDGAVGTPAHHLTTRGGQLGVLVRREVVGPQVPRLEDVQVHRVREPGARFDALLPEGGVEGSWVEHHQRLGPKGGTAAHGVGG
mmetsp:Transcript_136000/g.322252  ORF Transcript_136000/g.322252 Transcript_136000/m.322252 type:complete len:235 (+) Transcript_136000:293-997(+)